MIRSASLFPRTLAALLVASTALAGCAPSSPSGDPGARAMPSGQSCQSVRAELDKLDRKGVGSKVEAARSGAKMSAESKAEVDRYNQLLAYYLGARCHV